LQVKTIWAARAISVLFPQITTIGGYRQDALKWHPSGLAIDLMIPNHDPPEGIELGDQIAGFALANAKRWGINHVIWRQKIYPGDEEAGIHVSSKTRSRSGVSLWAAASRTTSSTSRAAMASTRSACS
jgi:hypothetical protein